MGSVEFGNLKLDRAGIAEFCRSAEMQAALAEVVDPIGEACNEEAYANIAHDLHIPRSDVDVQPYEHGAKALRNTAIGYVNVRGLGHLNESIHHTLTKRNH